MTIKQSVFTFLLTTIIGVVFNFLLNIGTIFNNMDFVLLGMFIIIVAFSIPNVVFLILLNKLNLIPSFFQKTIYLLLEIIVLFSIYLILDKLVSTIPDAYHFDCSDGQMAVKFYLTKKCLVIYSFLILFCSILIMAGIKKQVLKKA